MNLLDLFSGIGGFHLGLERAGFEFDYVGFAEVDKYASAVYKYQFPIAEELGDVKSIRPENLPKIDIITFGSPCQDFSIAGKRAGATEGTRSSLIWEAIRLITECKPRFFIWENVKGTFSSNNGADFWAIIQAFTNIGSYRLEWQLLNTRWFLPQNRERLYLVGYTGDRGGQSVFPIGESGAISDNRKAKVASTLQHTGHSGGNYRGMTMIADYRIDEGLRLRRNNISPTLTSSKNSETQISSMSPFVIKEATKKGYAEAEVGDSINLSVPNSKTRRGRVGKGEAQTLDTGMQQYTIQSGIRRLTPVECMRLQGFPDNHNEFGLLDGKKVAISDTQRYKQAGNAVTVDVVEAVAKKIYAVLHD